jgi:transcriptional regulator with XRE-family HTH domain
MANCSKALADNLRRGLAKASISQAEFAKRAGVSPQYLNQVLSGANENPSLTQLEGIAQVIGVSLAELITAPADFKRLAAHSDLDCWARVGEIWSALNDGKGKAVLADLRKGIKRDPRSEGD